MYPRFFVCIGKMSAYARVWLDIITLAWIVLGALNWGLVGLLGVNVVERVLGKKIAMVVYVIIGLSALVHVVSRDYYLRFLGQAAFPCDAMLERIPEGADLEVAVQVEPHSNVIYWASEPQQQVQSSPWIAYQAFANAGVARSDAQGRAVLRVRGPPSAYQVGLFRKTLKPHIHYRVCNSQGMLSRVETVYV